jgi:YGGT family
MPTNSYPDESRPTQPAEMLSPMEDLPLKAVSSQIPTSPNTNTDPEIASAEARQEEARTIRYAIGKLNDFLQWFAVVLEITLLIRFFLKLIEADAHNLFAGFLYALTDILLFPFAGILPWATPPHEVVRFEWSTLIAMIVYWLIFWAIRRFLLILISSPEEGISGS